LLKSIGEVEEFQPLEARPIREVRSVFGCLGGHGYTVSPSRREPPGLDKVFNYQPQQIARTEKVGSGCYNKATKSVLETGFSQLDAYGQARREISYASMDSYHRRLKQDRKKRLEKSGRGNLEMEAMAAARDAVRCVEHAMIVIAGEKNVYRTIVTPALAKTEEEAAEEEDEGEVQVMSPYYRKACVGTYSYVVGAIVDRALDVIETVFLKEGGIGQTSGKDGSTNNALSVTAAAAAAAAGLRMLDGVRMLGPSLAKLCEMPVNDGHTDASSSIASVLCIAIHRATVKNTARTLENLAKAIQEDPNKGPLHRPKDASVSVVSADTVKAIRSVSPFMSAYRSVSKRRALPWDPNMGEEAGEMDSFVRYLIMRLLNSLKGKALDYTRDGRDDSQAKANIFMINNAFYLLEELGPNNMPETLDDETYRISGSWFVDKVTKMMESETTKYVAHWEALNTHLTAVDTNELEYKKDGVTLSHDSGRLIKQRFSGFNEAFKLTWDLHKSLCVIDPRLRLQVQQGVSGVFLPRYRRFFEKYKK
jgi:exocyst complex protein 7